jgi:hypothetical protein
MDKDIINKFLAEMLNLLKDTKAFAVAELPQVAQQVLKYELVHNISLSVFWLMLLLVAAYIQHRIKKYVEETDDKDAYMMSVFPFSLAIFSVGFVVVFADKALEIYLAPKLFLLNYFTHLIKY